MYWGNVLQMSVLAYVVYACYCICKFFASSVRMSGVCYSMFVLVHHVFAFMSELPGGVICLPREDSERERVSEQR